MKWKLRGSKVNPKTSERDPEEVDKTHRSDNFMTTLFSLTPAESTATLNG